MKWLNLSEYAKQNGKSRNAALSLAHRNRFPKGAMRRQRAGGRCVLIEIQAGTPWPARKWAKRTKNAEIEG